LPDRTTTAEASGRSDCTERVDVSGDENQREPGRRNPKVNSLTASGFRTAVAVHGTDSPWQPRRNRQALPAQCSQDRFWRNNPGPDTNNIPSARGRHTGRQPDDLAALSTALFALRGPEAAAYRSLAGEYLVLAVEVELAVDLLLSLWFIEMDRECSMSSTRDSSTHGF
jgi:hypothetical protein